MTHVETGEVLQYISAKEAIKDFHMVVSKVTFCLNNPNRSHHGYRMRYTTEEKIKIPVYLIRDSEHNVIKETYDKPLGFEEITKIQI